MISYYQDNKLEMVVYDSHNDLSWDKSYTYFKSNQWKIGILNNEQKCWVRTLIDGQPKIKKSNKDNYNKRNKFEPIVDHNIVDWTPLRLKRLRHLIGCETDKETIMESFATSKYDQIKIGMSLLNINRKKVSIEKHRKAIEYEATINQHN
jgi:hypothetical protein